MKLWKEIIKPGQYHTSEGVVVATPERIRHWMSQFRAMRRAGLGVPIPWEHQDDAEPTDAAQRMANEAKHNAGWLEDVRVNSEGMLLGLCDIPDDGDAEHIKKKVRFVSPEIAPRFRDGENKTWRDVITHVALTCRPVYQRQKPFGAPLKMSAGRVRLSMTQLSKGAAMAEEKSKTDEMEAKDADKEAKKFDMSEDDDAPEEMAKTPEEYLEECKTQLADHGINLPDHVTMDTFIRDLAVALHALNNKEADETEYEPEATEAPVKESAGMMMSLRKQLKEARDQNAGLLSEKELTRLAAYEKAGRCSPATAKTLREQVGKHRLSFGAKSDNTVAVLRARLDQIAEVPPGTFGAEGQKRLSLAKKETNRTPHGTEEGPGVTAERGAEAAKEIARNAGLIK